ncbi:TR10A factor, partial [Anthoscopus minutus]|nr:TR10A factor [Anthoscopus minutus]
EQNGSGRCEPCGYGEYMEYPNAFRWCQDCLKCREDQVERSPCQPTRNTECACRNGSFCPPEHPCEMCQKCQPRCPEGQVVLKPCTPDSDLQCGPATRSGFLYLWVIIPVTAAVILPGVVFCLRKRGCSSPGRCRGPPEHPPWLGALWWVNVGAEDNATNAQLQSQQRHTATKTLVPVTLPLQEMQPSPKRSLVPAPGHDPIQVLRRSFYTFARKVPRVDWKKFGRSLDLEENDVVMVTSEDGFYEMLNKWLSREGFKSSVNTLLRTLEQLHLGGVAEDISSTLVQDGFFQYETT